MRACSSCNESGKVACFFCNGAGTKINHFGNRETCSYCDGSGRSTCMACLGSGKETSHFETKPISGSTSSTRTAKSGILPKIVLVVISIPAVIVLFKIVERLGSDLFNDFRVGTLVGLAVFGVLAWVFRVALLKLGLIAFAVYVCYRLIAD